MGLIGHQTVTAYTVLQLMIKLLQGENIKYEGDSEDWFKLVHMTPESKGMLLYNLTRHGNADHFQDFGLTDRKKAIITIGRSILNETEFHKIMWRIHPMGEKDGTSYNRQAIYDILQVDYGISWSNIGVQRDVNDVYFKEWQALEKTLKTTEYPKGYPFLGNDEPAYLLCTEDNPDTVCYA